jgi:hypothetical protein
LWVQLWTTVGNLLPELVAAVVEAKELGPPKGVLGHVSRYLAREQLWKESTCSAAVHMHKVDSPWLVRQYVEACGAVPLPIRQPPELDVTL